MVSVALCTHNGAAFLEPQLRSILGQTVRPAEIVLSDDASTDETVAIARRLIEADAVWAAANGRPPVELRVLENRPALGVVRNFEQALLACRGDIISLCDQDDVWDAQRLEILLDRFDADPRIALLHSDAELVDDDGIDLGSTLLDSLEVPAAERDAIHRGHGFDVLLRRNVVTGATVAVRRELLETAAPFPASWVHDEWLAMMAAVTARFDLVEEALVEYRQHDRNQIGARKLSVRQKISKLREPRDERNRHLVERAQALVAKVEELGDAVEPLRRRRIRQKLAHDTVRERLPASRLRRVGPILALGLARYRRFSRGPVDMLRDLVQPVD